jgi:hypothetical protein
MVMFESQLQVCDTTGIASFEITWDLGNGRKKDHGSFVDRRDAEKYILSSKRSYILRMFEKYVSHSRILFETGHHDFYRKESKLTALERCIRYCSWLEDKPLQSICKVILSLEEDLRKILPSPGNPSHSSSESRIVDMVVFAKRELSQLPEPQRLKR